MGHQIEGRQGRGDVGVQTGADEHPQPVIPCVIFDLPAGPEERFSGVQAQRERYGAADETAASGGTVFAQGLRQPHQELQHSLLTRGVAGILHGNGTSEADRHISRQRQGDIGMTGIRRVFQRQHIAVPAAAGLVQQINLPFRGDLRPQEVVFKHRRVMCLRQRPAAGRFVHTDTVDGVAAGGNRFDRQPQVKLLRLDEAGQIQRRGHAAVDLPVTEQRVGNRISVGVKDRHAARLVRRRHVQTDVHTAGSGPLQRVDHSNQIVAAGEACAADMGVQKLQTARLQRLRRFLDRREPILHMAVYGVLAAAADAVVGVVADEHPPEVVQRALGIAAAHAAGFQQRVQRLQPPFQPVLQLRVFRFQIDP